MHTHANGNIEALSGVTQQNAHGNVEAPFNRRKPMAIAGLAVELSVCCSAKSLYQVQCDPHTEAGVGSEVEQSHKQRLQRTICALHVSCTLTGVLLQTPHRCRLQHFMRNVGPIYIITFEKLNDYGRICLADWRAVLYDHQGRPPTPIPLTLLPIISSPTTMAQQAWGHADEAE